LAGTKDSHQGRISKITASFWQRQRPISRFERLKNKAPGFAGEYFSFKLRLGVLPLPKLDNKFKNIIFYDIAIAAIVEMRKPRYSCTEEFDSPTK
jgi:hypothetical protein